MAQTNAASESTAGRNRRKVGVKPIATANFLYGFYTPVDTSEGQALGHIADTGANEAGICFLYGVNSPRPARVKRLRETGATTTTFLSSGITPPATWKKVSSGRYRIPTGSGRTKPVYVQFTVDGVTIKYAWNMPATTYARIGAARQALGIKDVTEGDHKTCVWGCNTPKPPKAKLPNAGAGSITTFFEAGNTLPTGWTAGAGGGISD